MPSRGRKHKRQAFRGAAYALGMSPRMLRRLRYTMPVGTRSVFPTSTSAKILQRMQDAQESIRSHIQEAYCNPLLQAWAQEARNQSNEHATKEV